MFGWVVSVWVGSQCWILECGWLNLSGRVSEWVGGLARETDRDRDGETDRDRERGVMG